MDPTDEDDDLVAGISFESGRPNIFIEHGAKPNRTYRSEDEITDDTDWRIAEWGYDDPSERAAFLNGPSLEELTRKLREEVGAVIEVREERAGKAEKEKMFKNVGRNDPCPCGSGKKFKKCCGR